ncbi:hypothetical protein O6H91_12G101900 [Diphasiastrum complanatum]|uniref:Uncharacterized protein n=1 Tax=Diphasiastrum complanatum TaxID=34168 RepID=A0ACC2C5N5_DIPCM|nr:hypothetical protein O6H91_12G101900 [Diphasiastrum complanatum]
MGKRLQVLAKLTHHMRIKIRSCKAFFLCNSAAFALALGLGIVIYEISAEAFESNYLAESLYFPLYLPHAVGLSLACAFDLFVSPGNFLGFLAARSYFSLRMNCTFTIAHSFALLAIAFVGTIEVHLASYMLHTLLARNVKSKARMPDSLKDALVFLAVVSTAPSVFEILIALIECTSNMLPWSSFSRAWSTSWLGATAAMINVSPFILHCFIWELPASLLRPRKLLECLILILLTLGLLSVTFVISFNTFLRPLPYVFYPIIIYAVFRFNRLGWAAILCAISLCASFSTINRRGTMYSVLGSPNPVSSRDILQIQILISVIGAVGVVLSGAAREAKSLSRKLNKMNEELEVMVDQRTKELVKANEELQASKRIAEEASTAKSLFLANMSHEIRTPIHGILGMAAVMLESQLTVDQSDHMLSIKECADLLLQIINSILDLAKVEAGHLEVESVPFSVERMLNSTMKMLQPRAQALQLDLRWEIDNRIPDVLVGDPGKVQQCLLNLVGNSLKFTHQGSVAVKVALCEHLHQWSTELPVSGLEQEKKSICNSFACHGLPASSVELYGFNHLAHSTFYVDIPQSDGHSALEKKKNFKEAGPEANSPSRVEHAANLPQTQNVYEISFEVSDTGIGISKEKLNDIFKPFTQADPSISRLYGGTGLGLCIVQRFAELMGGHISAHSEIGEGSTFTFVLPLKCADINKESHKFLSRHLLNQENSKCLGVCNFERAQSSKSESVAFSREEEQEIQIEEFPYSKQPSSEDPRSMMSQFYNMPELSKPSIHTESKENSLFNRKMHLMPLRKHSSITSNDTKLTESYRTSGASEHLILKIEEEKLHQTKHTLWLSSESQSNVTQALAADLNFWINHASQTHLRHRHDTKEHESSSLKNELKLSILLAEDNPVNQKLASIQLQKHGHRVTIVGDGFQALSMIQTNRDAFDLVLMDVQMPIMDGLEATKRIREEESHSDLMRLPIVGLTAHAIQGYQDTCLSAGMDAYLGKPFDIKQLLDVINTILQPKEMSTSQSS